jgi:hypothetical protein
MGAILGENKPVWCGLLVCTSCCSYTHGGAVSLNLALAKYYQNLPIEERKYGLVFLFQGDHGVPGVGGTVPFIARHYNLMKNNLLLVLRPEHLGMTQILDEGVYISKTNVSSPLMTLVTNLNKKLIEILTQASVNYSFPIGDLSIRMCGR